MKVPGTPFESKTFCEFMREALYGDNGYYTNKVRIGAEDADFYTASQFELFGFTLADYVCSTWTQWDRPPRLQVVEMGAGQGELMDSILYYLRTKQPHIPVEYVVVETSPMLAGMQQSRMLTKHHHGLKEDQVRWGQPISSIPTVFIANEVLDALPVERVRRTLHGWEQAYVVPQGESHRLQWKPASSEVSNLSEQWLPIPVGFEAEICTQYRPIMKEVASYGNPIALLWIDYGITFAELSSGIRPKGTIRAYRKHDIVDVFECAGDCDITSDVHWDFMADECANVGFEVRTLRTQGQFLMDNGIVEIAQYVERELQFDPFKLSGQMKQLILPMGMGERFSVLECRKG